MDIYTNPALNTYTTGTFFWFPPEKGKLVYSIAVEKSTGTFIVAGYSILLTLLFSAFWTLITAAVMKFAGNPDTNRTVGLTGFLNAREPWTASKFLLGYVIHGERNKLWGITLLTLSLAMYYGGIAVGVVVPGMMLIGNGVPPSPDSIFFPRNPPQFTDAEKSRLQSLQAPAAMRAAGSVEAADVTLRHRVSISDPINGGIAMNDAAKPIITYTYSYEVSAWDFNIQHAPSLQQNVEGSCTTEYGWLKSSTQERDTYKLWNLDSQRVAITKSGEDTDGPPYAVIESHPDSESMTENGNYSFAIVPHTANHRSFFPSSDPWYSATSAPQNTSSDGAYRVLSGRPVLSCWQTSSWSFNGKTVDSIFKFSDLPGLDLPDRWEDHMKLQLGAPRIVSLGRSLGRSILVSAATALQQNFDASVSSITKDLTRLILASFVSSRDIFRDSTMVVNVDVKDKNTNMARDDNGNPASRVNQFVLSSGDVSTVSVVALASIPIILAVLYILQAALWCALRIKKAEDTRAWVCGLEATQLFRMLHIELVRKETAPGKLLPSLIPTSPGSGSGSSPTGTGGEATPEPGQFGVWKKRSGRSMAPYVSYTAGKTKYSFKPTFLGQHENYEGKVVTMVRNSLVNATAAAAAAAGAGAGAGAGANSTGPSNQPAPGTNSLPPVGDDPKTPSVGVDPASPASTVQPAMAENGLNPDFLGGQPPLGNGDDPATLADYGYGRAVPQPPPPPPPPPSHHH